MDEIVFVVMPFADDVANAAYEHITKPVVESFGLTPIRADEIFTTNPIFDDIVTAIEQAAIVIVDISGKNPNCFYELGMSHTVKRSRTIMVTHDSFDTVPFDVAHFRILPYEDSIKGEARYASDLRKTIQSIMSGLGDLYRNEFATVVRAITGDYGTGGNGAFYLTLVLAQSTRPITAREPADIEGHHSNAENRAGMRGGSCMSYARPLLELDYATVSTDIITLTEKGQAFAEYLTQEGYVIDKFNELTFTPGYESWWMKKGREKEEEADSITPEEDGADSTTDGE